MHFYHTLILDALFYMHYFGALILKILKKGWLQCKKKSVTAICNYGSNVGVILKLSTTQSESLP